MWARSSLIPPWSAARTKNPSFVCCCSPPLSLWATICYFVFSSHLGTAKSSPFQNDCRWNSKHHYRLFSVFMRLYIPICFSKESCQGLHSDITTHTSLSSFYRCKSSWNGLTSQYSSLSRDYRSGCWPTGSNSYQTCIKQTMKQLNVTNWWLFPAFAK